MTFSRREFLRAAGITLAATQLDTLTPLAALADAPLKGRVLEPVRISGATLWPDSVVRILDADETRYRLAEGWLPRSAIQPMFLYSATMPMRAAPVYLEVHAPVAPVYQRASVTAPLLARIGHGGVLAVQDALPGPTGAMEWIGVRHRQKIGWLQAERVTQIDPMGSYLPAQSPHQTDATSPDRLIVDRARQTLTASSGERVLMTTLISTATTKPLWAGECGFGSALPSQAGSENESHVQSWWLRANNGYELAGVYWHNAFGAPQPGPDIQLPMPVARWLYRMIAPDAKLTVV